MIRNVTRDIVLAETVEMAEAFWPRVRGLLGRPSLEPGRAMVIPRCCAIHTWFMQFPIDVVFLARSTVVKLAEQVSPWRLVFACGADGVIELPAGTIARTSTRVGERLSWTGAP